VIGLAPNPGPGPAFIPFPGNYYIAYNQGVSAFGASASRTFDLFNVAVEGSVRNNQALASSQSSDISALTHGPATNVSDNPGYATGHTAHINVSTLASLPANALWREATLTAELAWTRLLSISKNAAAIDPNGTRDGVAMRFVLEPTYRSVLPGVDVGVPFGAGFAPKGSRPLSAGGPAGWLPENGGDVSIGLNASFRDAWRFTLNYTHYYGSIALGTDAHNAFTWKQPQGDRDFVAASLRYSF
jgi:hypothetical protein